MKRTFKLVSLRQHSIIELQDVYHPYDRMMIWFSQGRWHAYLRGVPMKPPMQQKVIEDLHAKATAYGTLMGTCEGFPEQEIDV